MMRLLLTRLVALALLLSCGTAVQAPQLDVGLPVDGTVVKLPLTVTGFFDVPDVKSLPGFANGTASLCVEIDGRSQECKLLDPKEFLEFVLQEVSLGPHSLRLVVRAPGGEHAPIMVSSSPVTFTNVEFDEFMRQMHDFHQQQERPDLLTWAASFSPIAQATSMVELPVQYTGEPSGSYDQPPPPTVVVGVKTSVVHGFPFRQAIRDTWANKSALPQNVEVLFIGCRPDPSQVRSIALQHALALERQQYGDLLTYELDCDDGYEHLVTKVTEFLHFVTARESKPDYIMIADDDIYLRTRELSNALQYQARRSRYYTGQVYATQFGIPFRPIRDPQHQNHVSEAQYPMDELVPYAVGAHLIMSIDCAQFIARNRKQLRPLASLDDVSIALWLLMLQVHPEYSSSFHSLRNSGCQRYMGEPISLADLSPTGIRAVHENAQNGRSFCHGLNRTEWRRMYHTLAQALRARTKVVEPEVTALLTDTPPLMLHDRLTA